LGLNILEIAKGKLMQRFPVTVRNSDPGIGRKVSDRRTCEE
jgi:hypothetical protein